MIVLVTYEHGETDLHENRLTRGPQRPVVTLRSELRSDIFSARVQSTIYHEALCV